VTDGRNLARQYLEQQRQLGRVIVLSSAAAPPALPTPGESPGPPGSPGPQGSTPPEPPSADNLPAGLSFDPPPADLFARDPIAQATTLDAVAGLIQECAKCRLCDTRTRTVPGEGAADARIVVVGEGPGRREDETGRPFVGQAGELLTKILAAIDLPREQVYICNVVKCRPPENRVPQFDEIAACVPYLHRQIELVRPRVILAMGGTAAQTLLNTKQSLGGLRQRVHRFRGTPLIVTYHPAALLRNPHWKRPTWDDVRIARRFLD
jgi:DNA polymerase